MAGSNVALPCNPSRSAIRHANTLSPHHLTAAHTVRDCADSAPSGSAVQLISCADQRVYAQAQQRAEWVELFKSESDDLDIGNWKIDDDTIGGSQTTIAAGTLIPANGLLVVALTTNILNDTAPMRCSCSM